MSELANRTVPVDDVFGRFGRELVQRVGDAPDWPARFALIDAAIRARLADAAPVDPGVEWSLRRITDSGGTATISGLAGELGWSHRRLIARYRDAVGLPPKLVARIVRFERLAALVASDPATDWSEAALACGFFDQAHMTREVRKLADIAPTELRAQTVKFRPRRRARCGPSVDVMTKALTSNGAVPIVPFTDPHGNVWCFGTYWPGQG